MNTEIIKIEPPIVVKEELEVDNNKIIEVKLEDEEKPQLVEEFTSKENNPSTSEIVEKDDFNFDKPSVVAEDEIFGIKLEDGEKSQPVKEFILIENKPSISGTVELDEVSYLVMKDLEFRGNNSFEVKLENEEKPHVLDELTSEEKDIFEELTSEVFEMNESEFKEVISESNLLTCSHCGEKRTSSEMVQTPETENELSQWSKLLGKKSCENFTMRSPVCRNHFIDKLGDSRLIDIIQKNGRIETKLGDRLRCCYCGESRMSRSTTTVPKDKFFMTKWCEILGEDFEEFFKRNTYGSICRTHFSTEWKGHRPNNLLPVANKKNFEKDVITVRKKTDTEIIIAGKKVSLPSCKAKKKKLKYTCVYCEEKKTSEYMTRVPLNPNTLKKWSDILGEEFYRKALSKKIPLVCRSHFNAEWSHTRPPNLLPHANSACARSDQVICDNSTMMDVKLEEPEINENSEQKSVHLHDKHIKTQIQSQEFEMKLNKNSEIPKQKVAKKKPYTILCLCAYCGETKPIRIMTTTPYDPNTLRQWGQILGEKFYMKALGDGNSFICRSHFNVGWSHMRPRNLLPHAARDNSPMMDVKLEEPEINEDSDKKTLYLILKNIKPKTRSQKFESEMKLKKNSEIPKHKNAKKKPLTIFCMCAYCGEKKPDHIMTKIPTDPNTLRQWGQILGERFYRNALADENSFICRIHFNGKWLHTRPRNLFPYAMNENSNRKSPHLQDKHIKTQIQSQEFEMKLNKNLEVPKYMWQVEKVVKKKPCAILCLCAYCGETKPIHVMTMIPYDPYTLRLWGQILGEDFYRNALADENSFICRSHFNAEWSHMRPRNLLPQSMNKNSNKNSEILKYINQDGHSDRKKIKLEANEAK